MCNKRRGCVCDIVCISSAAKIVASLILVPNQWRLWRRKAATTQGEWKISVSGRVKRRSLHTRRRQSQRFLRHIVPSRGRQWRQHNLNIVWVTWSPFLFIYIINTTTTIRFLELHQNLVKMRLAHFDEILMKRWRLAPFLFDGSNSKPTVFLPVFLTGFFPFMRAFLCACDCHYFMAPLLYGHKNGSWQCE